MLQRKIHGRIWVTVLPQWPKRRRGRHVWAVVVCGSKAVVGECVAGVTRRGTRDEPRNVGKDSLSVVAVVST